MKYIFYFCLFSIFIVSCNSQTNDATAYNNSLLSEQKHIADEMEIYLGKLKDTPESSNLIKIEESLLKQINESIQVLNKLEDFNGSSIFKESVISVLNSYYQGIKNEYSIISTYHNLPDTLKSTDRKWQAEQHAIHADEEIEKAEDYFILMQQKFAEENNFKLD